MDAVQIGASAGSGAVVGWGLVRLIPWEAVDSKWRPLMAGILAFGASAAVGILMGGDTAAVIVTSLVVAFGPTGVNEAMKLTPGLDRLTS